MGWSWLLAAAVVLAVGADAYKRHVHDDVSHMPWIQDMDERHEHDEYYIDSKPGGLKYIDYIDGEGEPLKVADEVELMFKLYLKKGHQFVYSHPTPQDAFKFRIGAPSREITHGHDHPSAPLPSSQPPRWE